MVFGKIAAIHIFGFRFRQFPIGIDNKRKIIAAIFANGFNCRFWNVISHTTPPSLYSPARHGWQVQYSRGKGK